MAFFEVNPDMPERWLDHATIKKPSAIDPRKDYVDVTPENKSTATAGTHKFKRESSLSVYEKREAMFNLGNLSFEGVLKKVELWLASQNRFVLEKYKYMVKNCERFAKSGKLEDGRYVFSRDINNKPKWVGHLNVGLLESHRIIKKKKKTASVPNVPGT